AHDQGYVTSAAYSPILESSIGLGFVKGGFDRMGEHLRLVNPLERQEIIVEITSPHFVDPEGEKLRA
uniref:glycine cleavage T C-terminal barrel domain-containing protein n=1 Tax=Aliiroseovarius sp. TaxID=1872442 RepID=UPI00260EF06D